jgi:hypothetical protein
VTDLHVFERQMTTLAARADPIAFDHPNDLSLQDRRLAARRTSADRLIRLQTYLSWGAGAALLVATVGWIYGTL